MTGAPPALRSRQDFRGGLHAWGVDLALPLWSQRGLSRDGRFHEGLGSDGRPEAARPRRTRSQARQIVAVLHGRRLGWTGPAEALAARAFDCLTRDFRGRRPGSWIETVDADGRPQDTRPDLYTQACVLLALAEIQALERDDRPLSMALETLGFIEAAMADAQHGGWREAVPARLPRRQNPHMHLLEAMLAWLRVRDRPAFRSVAERVLALFDARFARSDGALIERFTRAWTPHSVHGTVVEPGHHAEWIWLLEEARALGLGDRTAARDALYDRLRVQLGMDGWAVNAVSTDGTPINAGRRLWPQCEVLRAHLVMGERAAAERLARAILDTHLNAPTSGLWIDAFDDRGEPKHGLTPASSFYHLTGAVLALSRYGV